MKTASLPSLRVDPELRQAAESVLLDGESLSSLMESSLRASVSRCKGISWRAACSPAIGHAVRVNITTRPMCTPNWKRCWSLRKKTKANVELSGPLYG